MIKKHTKSKYEIGDTISTFDRNLEITDKECRETIRYKNNKPYKNHRWYYKYKCLNCGNEDWIVDYSLSDYQHCGCNACCIPPKKIVKGINDIATTNPWMIKYFVNPDDATKYSKFSNARVDMKCPDCGRSHNKKKIGDVYHNKNLTCPCQDGWSYPNKFMYSLLEQIGVYFETEKFFDWSNNRLYDDYIEYDGLKIITEQHGQQHYFRQFNKNSRTVEEEIKNDKYKYDLALSNGIDRYFIIDSSTSTLEHMKDSIINSGLLVELDVDENIIDWLLCDKFATSNFAKQVCEYKNNHPYLLHTEIANNLHISYGTVSKYLTKGLKLGWCNYDRYDDLKTKRDNGFMLTNQRPIHCISNGKYYRGSREFVEEYEKEYGKKLDARNIRHVCEGKRNHVNNLKFEYITQEEFNNIKSTTPDLVIGECFKLKEIA